jgi:hypothetical protein
MFREKCDLTGSMVLTVTDAGREGGNRFRKQLRSQNKRLEF